MATFTKLHAQVEVRCEGDGHPNRGAARRLLRGTLAPAAGLISAARASRANFGLDIGRVLSGGSIESGSPLAQLIRPALASALPAPLASHLRSRFEWYGCRGAAFHNDAHYGNVLFGAWCIDGPAREIVFPRVAARIAAVSGSWVVFDPFEPHAVLTAGRDRYHRSDYQGADAISMFLAFELDLSQSLRDLFLIGEADPKAQPLSSRVPINAETGAIG